MTRDEQDEVLDLLRAAHHEPLDAAHYTAVRARVLAEIERTRAPWRRLAWISGLGAVAAGIVLAFVTARRVEAPIPPLPVLALARPVAPAPVRIELPIPVVRRLAASTPKPHREPLTIKLQTADPNIVIYWIAD